VNILQLLKSGMPHPMTWFVLLFALFFFIAGIVMLNKANSIELKQYQIFGGRTSFDYQGQVIIEIEGDNLIIRFPDMYDE